MFGGARAGFLALPGFLGASRDRGAVGAQVNERAPARPRAKLWRRGDKPQNGTDTRTKCVFRTRFPARACGRGFRLLSFFTRKGFPGTPRRHPCADLGYHRVLECTRLVVPKRASCRVLRKTRIRGEDDTGAPVPRTKRTAEPAGWQKRKREKNTPPILAAAASSSP